MKNKAKQIKVCNIVCALLILALLVCQVMPFWSIEDHTSSIQGYVWFPSDHNALTNHFSAEVSADYVINDIILMPIVVLAAGVLGVFFCFSKSDRVWTALFPLLCGLFGVYGYLAKPVFQMGSLWQLHLVLCIAMTAAAVVSLVLYIKPTQDQTTP